MTNEERKVFELALEALEKIATVNAMDYEYQRWAKEHLVTIKETLAQPEQEPVAYGTWDTMLGKGHRMMMVRLDKGQDGCTVPLYTTPPQRTWVGLTNDEINNLAAGCHLGNSVQDAIYKAVAKLKEKNNA